MDRPAGPAPRRIAGDRARRTFGSPQDRRVGDTAGIGIARHNPLGLLAGVAALHFNTATTNFVIQEEMSGAVPWFSEVAETPIRMVDGAWTIPEVPGLGVEVNETAAAKHPFEQEIFHTRPVVIADGTIVDW